MFEALIGKSHRPRNKTPVQPQVNGLFYAQDKQKEKDRSLEQRIEKKEFDNHPKTPPVVNHNNFIDNYEYLNRGGGDRKY